MALNKAQSAFIGAKTLASVNDTTPFLPGQVGKVVEIPGSQGAVTTGDLAGVYQYVQRTSGDTVAMSQGSLLFWADIDNFVVTDAPAAAFGGAKFPAGLALGTAPAAGKYGFIQVAGIGVANVAATCATTGFNLVADTSRTPSGMKVQTSTTLAEAFIPVVANAVSTVAATVPATIQAALNLPRISW